MRYLQQHSTAPISYAGINREMKSIYRALVKHCHPDSGHYNAAAHTGIRQLNAVKSHSVNSLWNIQREWPQTLLPHAYGEQLVRLYDAIDQCIRKMLARIRSIRKSPAYQLKERARYARLNGVDLVEKIAADLKEKITSHRLMQTAA